MATVERGVKAGIELYTGRKVKSFKIVEDSAAYDCRAWAIRAEMEVGDELDMLVVGEDDTPIEEMPAENVELLIQDCCWKTWPPTSNR